nr:immunoglobulin heavy chain junction region [Macaca mulatta]
CARVWGGSYYFYYFDYW